MYKKFPLSFRRSVATLGLVVLAQGPAHAGFVTGNWDPQFGAFLPGLSWQVKGLFTVSDACAAQANGDYAATGICATTVNNLALRLFDGPADPNNFFELSANSSNTDYQTNSVSPGYSVTDVRVTNGQIVGFSAGRADYPGLGLTPIFSYFSAPSSKSNIFGLTMSLNGPEMYCLACDAINGYPAGSNNGNPNVYADKTQLTQFLVTYTDERAPKAGTDSSGNPIGARLDGRGNFLGLTTADGTPASVSEPGSLPLALAAMAAVAGISARSRRRR